MRSRRYSGFGEPPKKHKKKDLRGILLTLVLFLAVIAVIAGIIFFAKKFIPSSLLPSFGKKDAGESTETAEEVLPPAEALRPRLEEIAALIPEATRVPAVDKTWAEIDEDQLNAYNGWGYFDIFPDVEVTGSTGYVGWAMTHVYGIEDYPHAVSTPARRNAGEYVDAHRMWLQEHAEFIGSATTVDGKLEYHGQRYQPGDIIVFNNQHDGREGTLTKGVSVPDIDYWGEDGIEFFTHIAIIGSSRVKYQEDLSDGTYTDTGEELPEGQYNMHQSSYLLGGVVNVLSPEQMITRDVPEDDMNFARSYEVYRVLK
ncbi:MAG: hypothetical protein K5707_00415 [Clostridia bacterium]|nr:hypothetical protein [Clostridia bacterium]